MARAVRPIMTGLVRPKATLPGWFWGTAIAAQMSCGALLRKPNRCVMLPGTLGVQLGINIVGLMIKNVRLVHLRYRT